jgi:8-oxo-dGTP pyrophosphatase MutT (NUDIX family)
MAINMDLGPAAAQQPSVPRDAATVLLLRDAPGGFEVFMVKRSGLSDVLGEAHVFPGGKIDAADSAAAMLQRIHGLARLDTATLGEDLPAERAAGMFVAAARETFEEAGVLLVNGAVGKLSAASLQAARDRLNAKESFAAVLASIDAQLDAAALVPWVRWVTPVMLAKRFDARFFLAAAPPDQVAVHDNFEATHSEWLRPGEAVRRWEQGKIQLAPATYMSVQHLAQFDSIASALADARSRRPPVLQPEGYAEDGVRCLALPGDPKHPLAERAIPGPTRLKWDGAKFIPHF